MDSYLRTRPSKPVDDVGWHRDLAVLYQVDLLGGQVINFNGIACLSMCETRSVQFSVGDRSQDDDTVLKQKEAESESHPDESSRSQCMSRKRKSDRTFVAMIPSMTSNCESIN